jgi:hypothetical protein|tara:strand:+ start:165 stop:1424 length:1260 start_codon:yes stop_codon:yes gene_type:complete
LNKLLAGMLFAFVCINSHADDLKVADDFKSGDLVSADTFNQIFNTLESINRSVIDTDLIGVWNCSAIHASGSAWNGWESKGLVYEIKDAQVNFTASSAETSLGEAYSFSTSSPTPFWRSSDPASADTGTYQLFKGLLVMKRNGDVNLVDWQVDIVSDSRFTLYKPIVNGNQPNYVVCDSAAAVPASPTSPTATNNKTGINLAWTDASSDETGFKVYRKLSNESEAKLIATQTAVTYSDTDLTEAQTAYYHVVAYNDNGDSTKSKEVSATLDGILPTVVSVTPIDNTVLTDADVDFSGGGSGNISLAITFSENIEVVCIKTDEMGGCDDSLTGGIYGNNNVTGAIAIAGGDNAYSWLSKGNNGSTFTNSIPCTACLQADNTDSFTITVRSAKIKDANGNSMVEDYKWSFTINDTDTYGSR